MVTNSINLKRPVDSIQRICPSMNTIRIYDGRMVRASLALIFRPAGIAKTVLIPISCFGICTKVIRIGMQTECGWLWAGSLKVAFG